MSTIKTRLSAIVFVAAVIGLTFAASLMMFSAFMFYDDEGYVLISLRNFAEHGHLYGEVYSQYGPFPYVFYYALHLLGLPFTHTAGRIVTLLMWSGAAVAGANLVWRETRSLAVQLAVLAAVFVYLWIMVSEPTHPGGLIAATTAGMAYLGYVWLRAGRVRSWAWLAGAGSAALLLTKINVGGLAALSAGAWLLLHHENPTVRRFAPTLTLISVAALPFLLMRPLLSAEWVQTYAILFACSGVAALGAVSLATSPQATTRDFGRGLAGAAVAGALIAGVTLARGSSLADLLEGVLLRPVRHPVHFNLDFPWWSGVRTTAVVSAILFGITWTLRRRGLRGVDGAVALARLGCAAALAVVILRFPTVSPDNFVLSYGLPCLWLFLWPLAGEERSAAAARSWVGLLFLGQCLHGFPVRGSQTAWGTLLAIPLAALGAWQAATWLAARFSWAPLRRRVAGATLSVALGAFAIVTGWRLAQVGNRYGDGRELNLPGAEHIILPDNATAVFRLLMVNAVAHGDMLFSLPGMYSLNLWSGLPTPTLSNVTHWFSLLDEAPQLEIVRSLEAHPHACVIIQREHVNFLIKKGFGPSGPLYDYIQSHFTPAFAIDDFEFCVRNGRKVAPLLVGEILRRSIAGTPAAADSENTLLKFALLLPPGAAVASVELAPLGGPAGPPVLLRETNARLEITPVNLDGSAAGEAATQAWPWSLNRAGTVSLYFDGKGRSFPPEKTLIVLRDARGTELALVRLKP